jgi:hypothetical protein
MRKRYHEQDMIFPDLDYQLHQEQQAGIAGEADSLTTQVAQAYAQLNQDQNIEQFNLTLSQLNAKAQQRASS